MATLSVQDLERLFKFSLLVNKSYENFEYAVLDALSDCLDMHFTSYTIADHNNDGTRSIVRNISKSIEEEILDEYKRELYKKDIFLNYFNEKRYNAVSTNIFTSNDFPADTFKNSEWGKYLAKYNIGHQAVIGIKNTPNPPSHTVSFYKPLDADPFSDYEIELFHRIGMVFHCSVSKYKEHIKARLISDIIGSFSDTMGRGYVVANPCTNDILCYNESFVQHSEQLSDKQSMQAIVKELVDLVNAQGTSSSSDRNVKQCIVDGYTIISCMKKISTPDGFRKYLVLSVNKPREASETNETKANLMNRFDLTSREAEVAVLMTKGYENTEIADKLYISMSTVKSHVHSIYSKFSVSTRTEFIRKLRTNGVSE
ncbi:MAG: LuxR C-terminal-related transcriptional regulator [Clostridiales Family XIII bacterium]|jgi:DNA-binding CsgD family transcriptional regulator|nr:LuxR C-terminal-related transcriptional regulator [Clostridiales Family XIII bacterium]